MNFFHKKDPGGLYQNHRDPLVELRGIEPLSENSLTGFSPGADGYLQSLTGA